MPKTQICAWIVAVATVWIASASNACAQAQSLFGRQGPVSGQSNALLGSSRGGGSGLTGRSGGLTGGGLTGGLSGGLTGGGSLTGGTTRVPQRGAFVGGNDSQTFVGGNPNAGPATNNRRNTGNRANRGGNRNTRNFNQFGNNQDSQRRGAGNRNGRRQQRRLIRPRQQVKFSYPERTTAKVVVALRTQFAQHAERYPMLANVSVLEEEGRIELYGTVETDEQRRLATILAKLEPGVREVENHITVESP